MVSVKNSKFSLLVGTLVYLHKIAEDKGDNCADIEKALSAALLINDENLPEIIEKDMTAISEAFLNPLATTH